MELSPMYNADTPLANAIGAHLYRKTASFHTPGHKGRAPVLKSLSTLSADLTELPDTGSLYDGGDAIEAAEIQAARAFGATQTFFSGGGCTLCIQAMLLLGAGAGGRVLMARNAHRSALHAAALLGLDVTWLWPDMTEINGFQQPSVESVESSLKADRRIRAVYVTSPDYAGNLCDIAGMAVVCRRAGVPLLVDNAHGSHLGAFERHPLALGAAMTADSAHKTLPVLTGGAWLHIRPGAPVSRVEAKAAMALFGSTSPAFPVLASLDLARRWWEESGPAAFRALAERVEALRRAADASGVVRAAFSERPAALRDPVRLVLDGAPGGVSGEALGAYLRARGCEPEHTDSRYAILIPTPFNTEEEFARLERALRELLAARLSVGAAAGFTPFLADERPEAVLSPRDALLRPAETVPVGEAAGRIAARSVCPCPPGIAAAVPGERLSPALARMLEIAGFSQIVVLKTL